MMKSSGASAAFKLFGIFGHPLSHTLSPVMQEAGFEKIGLKAFYSAFDLDLTSFKKVFRDLPRLKLDGFNVTVPYKQTVMPYLDQLSAEAKAVGAVNTVFRGKKGWIGTNTDVYGFVTALTREGKFQPQGKTALVFGAGGAARAVLYGLGQQGAGSVFVANRNKPRAEQMIGQFKSLFPKTSFNAAASQKAIREILDCADLAVNATSLGLNAKDSEVVNPEWISSAGRRPKLFFDLIYHVPVTPFLKAAKRKGHRILGGKGMLLFQGTKAFELWTGQKAPADVMRKALNAAIQECSK